MNSSIRMSGSPIPNPLKHAGCQRWPGSPWLNHQLVASPFDTSGRLSNQHKPLNRSDKDAPALLCATEHFRETTLWLN